MGNKIAAIFFGTLGAIFLILLIMMLGKAVYNDYTKPNHDYYDEVQDTPVHTALTVSTLFDSVEDAVVAHSSTLSEQQYIVEFTDIPQETVALLAHVLLKQKPKISVIDIVNKYHEEYTDVEAEDVGDPDPVAETNDSNEKLLDHIVDTILTNNYGN